MAHNGQLTNYEKLAEYLKKEKRRHLNTKSDSETLIHLLASGLEEQGGDVSTDEGFLQLEKATRNLMLNAHGSYSVVSSIIGKGLIALEIRMELGP